MAVNDAAAVLREEELLRRLVFLVRLVELVLDELLDFLFRHPSHLFPIITCIYYYTTSCAFFPCFFEINLRESRVLQIQSISNSLLKST